MKYFFIIIALCMAVLPGSYAQPRNVKNDVFWNSTDGKPVNSQGGGISRFADPVTGVEKYYWYGVYYEDAEKYRENPVAS
jgi:hypothetical protein